MTNEPIEAMARAIFTANYDAPDAQQDEVWITLQGAEIALYQEMARAALAAAEANGYRVVPDNWTREWAHELALLRGCSYEGAVTLIYEVLAAAPDHVADASKKDVRG